MHLKFHGLLWCAYWGDTSYCMTYHIWGKYAIAPTPLEIYRKFQMKFTRLKL